MCAKSLGGKQSTTKESKKYELRTLVRLSTAPQSMRRAAFTLLLSMRGCRVRPVLILVTLAVHVIAVPPPGRRNYTVLSTTPLVPRPFDT